MKWSEVLFGSNFGHITTQSNHEVCMSTARVHGNTCAQHSKTKMADGGKRSSRTEGFHMFRVWDPKTWHGNTKITEAFVYQLCCGYRTVKSRRQPVKMSTNFVFLPGYSSSALRCSSDYQTCQPLVKENLETHEKKSGDSTKNSEILFFPRSNPFSNAGTRHQP